MVASTFDTVAFPFMLGKEGGWDNDRYDRGNWTSGVIGKGELKGTKFGVAAHVYPHLDIKNMTIEEARAIYKRDYAAKVAYDAMPAGVDVSVYDMGVNAGPGRSLALLRAALSASTAAAPALATIAQAAPDKVVVIKKFSARRLSFYQGLNNARYIRGWSIRAAECEAVSVKTWLTVGAAKPAAEVKKQLAAEGKAATKASANNAGAGTVTGGAGGTGATQHEWVWQWDWTTALEVAAVAGVVVLIVYFGLKALNHKDRAGAYAKQAQAV